VNQSYRILVVDDDTNVANATARLLEQAGYSVERVCNGEDAWNIARVRAPDLVLLDRDLPGIDGLEVCRRIKRTPALAGSLVVLASASYVDSENQAEGLEAGADGYIARPIANRELLARVSAFVRMLSMSRTLQAQSNELKAATESTLQSQMATLNLLEDALEAQQRAERAQLALESSTRMLEVTGAIAKIGGWELDVLTSKLTWTRETFKIHGMEPPEPDLEKAIDAYTPEARVIVVAAVQAAIDFGTPYDLELQLVASDGRMLWVNSRGQAEMRDGKAVRLYGSFQDITERREAQAALVASEARARALIDSSPVPMAVSDRHERITFINPAFTLAFGYLPEDIPTTSQWWTKAYPDPVYRQRVMTAWEGEIARVQRIGDAFRPLEVQIRGKDGSPRNVLASVSWFAADVDGSFLVTMLDITERKRMERQVLQSEKLASIGLLAAGVAHEINNPIGYVNSNLGSLKRLVEDLLTVIEAYESVEMNRGTPRELWAEVDAVKARVDLDYLRTELPSLLADSDEGLRRVKRIVKGLKDFAHTSAVDAWQPDDLIQGLESTLNVVWNELKYTCEVHKEYVELPRVDCVLAQLNQVFMNLLVNAAQAIEGHGVITLRTGRADNEVWVEVADTGCGISAENMAHIFDPFFTTKEVSKGTGLGLSVSHGIIERHHGRIEVQSELGKGTTMRICLPIRQPDPA
jgi:PAS domain S-box-containing protein